MVALLFAGVLCIDPWYVVPSVGVGEGVTDGVGEGVSDGVGDGVGSEAEGGLAVVGLNPGVTVG